MVSLKAEGPEGLLVLEGLVDAFNVDPTLLEVLAKELSTAQYQLKQPSLQVRPFIGPDQGSMSRIFEQVKTGNPIARAELRRIRAYHAGRSEAIAHFLFQFSPEWAMLLLGGLRDTVTDIQLVAGPDSRVEQVRVRHETMLHEYGLRGFDLFFEQMLEIASWMREHPKQLFAEPVVLQPLTDVNDFRAVGARWANLKAFFHGFPPDMRRSLVKSARHDLVGLRIVWTTMESGVLASELAH